ncbi:MAG: cadherin [Cryomorphaceae bacterium]|nr:cadherin [Cryomorphaceae bacterium]
MRYLLSIALTALTSALLAQTPSELDIQLVQIASGLSSPVGIYNAGDNRLFILEQSQGDIEIITTAGTPVGKFLDLTGLISTGSERGLLGMAFHPQYASNGYFYVNYTNTSGNTVIARYTRNAGNPNVADPSSASIVMTIAQPFSNHNGGHIAFGPDGYLYIGMGDGGSADDPGNRSQNGQELLGKMLRIDVDGGSPYSIPSSNPFVGTPNVLDEIWAIGVRNPWKFSFDRLTGDLWIGDVGQNEWEEVNVQPAASIGGENYGWRCYEGFHPANTTGCAGASNYVEPVFEASHGSPDSWCSITGGLVYRGSDFPYMQGTYIFTDYCAGDFRALVADGGGYAESTVLGSQGFGFVAFGEDAEGEMYVAKLGGQIYRVVDACGGDVPAISVVGETLTAGAGGEVYWYANDAIVPGETGTSFSPSQSGNYYAVVEMPNGCFRTTQGVQWAVVSGIPGCTYVDATNYNASAAVDDGSCTFENTCPADINNDDTVNSADLLTFLGAYGSDCE